jgi:hypothetical protein
MQYAELHLLPRLQVVDLPWPIRAMKRPDRFLARWRHAMAFVVGYLVHQHALPNQRQYQHQQQQQHQQQ